MAGHGGIYDNPNGGEPLHGDGKPIGDPGPMIVVRRPEADAMTRALLNMAKEAADWDARGFPLAGSDVLRMMVTLNLISVVEAKAVIDLARADVDQETRDMFDAPDEDDCDHIDYEIDSEGRATCVCGHHWWPNAEQIARYYSSGWEKPRRSWWARLRDAWARFRYPPHDLTPSDPTDPDELEIPF